MNRLIIIGNGFDIAHNLKTKYSDFIAHYWEKINDTQYSDDFISFNTPNINLEDCHSLKSVIDTLSEQFRVKLIKKANVPGYSINNSSVLEIRNDFFFRINEKHDNANWVDIEMEYFSSIKRILNRPNNTTEDNFEEMSLKMILKLNNEIADIAKYFESYLITNVDPKIKSHYNQRVGELFKNYMIDAGQAQYFYEEFPKKIVEKIIKPKFQIYFDQGQMVYKFDDTYVLNFNYTKTTAQYLHSTDATVINIHGELGNPMNSINMGFGDERNDFYSTIENHNQNEYLRFMKSFQYTKNHYYKKLFDFIEDDDFQVQIMGHSCGLSDRTLLNAIFEHANCKSIKVYFHPYDTLLENGESDNYSEVVRNISRHFTQKTIMRDKIVNREQCEELPQLGK